MNTSNTTREGVTSTGPILKSNHYFRRLVTRFERKRVAERLGITTVHLWRLCHRPHLPSKKIIKRLAEWQAISLPEIETRLFNPETPAPVSPFPRVRNMICRLALFDRQREKIQFQETTTLDEEYLAGFFWLLFTGVRHLDQGGFCEVISPQQKEEGLRQSENLPQLDKEWQDTLGLWWRWDEFYYFQHASGEGRGLQFVSNMREYSFRSKVRQNCMKAITYFHPVYRENSRTLHE